MVLVVAFVAVLSACGGSSGSSGGGVSATQSGTPQRGGTLIVTYQGEPQTLDPAIDWETNGWAIEHAIFGNLLNYATAPGTAGAKTDDRHGDRGADASPTAASPTAARPTSSTCGRASCSLRRSAARCTAPDFMWSFERMLNLRRARRGRSLRRYRRGAGLSRRQGQDDHRLQGDRPVHARDRPRTSRLTTFNDVMAMPFAAPVAKEWVAKYGSNSVARHPAGHRPGCVRPLDSPARRLLISRNPNYSGTTAGYLDDVHFEFSVTHDRPAAAPKRRGRRARRLHPVGSGLPRSDG